MYISKCLRLACLIVYFIFITKTTKFYSLLFFSSDFVSG